MVIQNVKVIFHYCLRLMNQTFTTPDSVTWIIREAISEGILKAYAVHKPMLVLHTSTQIGRAHSFILFFVVCVVHIIIVIICGEKCTPGGFFNCIESFKFFFRVISKS
jgi:hypothetical protein